MTAAAYEWIRSRKSLRLFGTKGLSRDIPKRLRESRIDKMPGDKGIPIPGGLVLIEINTDAMKNLIWFRLNRNLFDCPTCKATTRFRRNEINAEAILFCKSCGGELPKKETSGMFTFHAQVEEEYIQHVLSEQLRLDIKSNQWEWVRIRKANHLLDCTVIAFAMADSEFRGGIRVIKSSGPGQPTDPNKPPPVNPVTHRPRGGWVKGW
jgi:phage terminase large subunit GpA-like protein